MFSVSNNNKMKLIRRLKRKLRIRKKIKKFNVYRLTVYKSLKHIYAQIFSKDGHNVLISASSLDHEISTVISSLKTKCKKKVAGIVGEFIAKRSLEKGILKVVFDLSGFRYHGRIKELADSARKDGLVF